MGRRSLGTRGSFDLALASLADKKTKLVVMSHATVWSTGPPPVQCTVALQYPRSQSTGVMYLTVSGRRSDESH
jgi:hypothetical protein